MDEHYHYFLDGQELGPFSRSAIVALLKSGKMDGAMLRQGPEQSWRIPEELGFIMAIAPQSAGPDRPSASPIDASPSAAEINQERQAAVAAARASLPPPPALHWSLVLLLSLFTLGLFGWVWYFIQAAYVRKIDLGSNATAYLVIHSLCCVVYVVVSVLSGIDPAGSMPDSIPPATTALLLALLLGGIIFFYCALYSMAGSLENLPRRYGVRMVIGGFTLFLFRSLYLQGQLSWLARWKATGQTQPGPPKGIFWVLLVVLVAPLFLLILLAIILPSLDRAGLLS